MPAPPALPVPPVSLRSASSAAALDELPHPDSPTEGLDAAPRRGRRKEARPGELLQAALKLFVEKGFAGTRAEEVAALAGVSKGTLFLYFESKEELFKAVVRENIGQRFVEWEAEFADTERPTTELIASCMQAWWDRVGATAAGGISKLMVSEAGNFPELAAFYQAEVVAPGLGLIRRILQRGMERGEFAPMDVEHTSVVLIAPLIFLNLHQHSLGACPMGQFIDPKAFLAAHLHCLLKGICARGPGTPATTTAGLTGGAASAGGASP